MVSQIDNSLLVLRNEAKDFVVCDEISVSYEVPSALEFYRNWVSSSKPVIFKNAIKHWPAIQHWTNDYLRNKIGSTTVTASVTPNGYADAVNGEYFVTPHEEETTFASILDKFCTDTNNHEVYYIQKQNSNFDDEFSELTSDIDTEIPWATEALGKKPDAVNFWMGDGRAVTSLHKDPYENLYGVVRGQKTFTLLPPTDRPWIPYGEYKSAHYERLADGKFQIVPDNAEMKVPWIPVDVLNPDYSKYPQYRNASPVTCTVSAGDLLYLPAFWFHHVQQSHQCIAVNFWYDMEFDLRYCYFKFVEDVVQKLSPTNVN